MEVVLNGQFGQRVLGQNTLRMGRQAENQLIVNDLQVSSFHAEIRPEAHGHSILDLGSSNGTFINNERLVPHVPCHLSAGDHIRLGQTTFTYEIHSPVGLPPTPNSPLAAGPLHPNPWSNVAPPPPVPSQAVPHSAPQASPVPYAFPLSRSRMLGPTPPKKSRWWFWLLLAPVGVVLVLCSVIGQNRAPLSPAPGFSVSPGTVAGRAVTSQEKPLSGADVTIREGASTSLNVLFQTRTGADGFYSLNVPHGIYVVEAYIDVTYHGHSWTLDLHPDDNQDTSQDSTNGILKNFTWLLTGVKYG